MHFVKLITAFPLLISFLINSVLIRILFPFLNIRRKFYALNISFYCSILLKILKIKVIFDESNRFPTQKPALIVSNHLSWLDIVIISSKIPCNFITSVEMKNNKVLGIFTKFGGSYFVERRHFNNLKREIHEISQAVKTGIPLCLFPEATSSDGTHILKFRNAMLEAFINKDLLIQPIVINYTSINNSPVTPENKDNIFWYGKMTFIPSLLRICKTKEISVSIKTLSLINAKNHDCRKQLGESIFNEINANFKPIV